jgi:hypothetical protein
MKTLWILAAAATFAACAKSSDEEVGAAPDRGDTTGVTTQVDTATGQWDTTNTTGAAQPDTAVTPTTPSDTTVGQYPTPSDTGMVDTTMTTPDTGAYAPADTGAYAPADTGAYAPTDTGAAVDTTMAPSEPSGVDTSGMSPDTSSQAAPQ